MIFLLDSYSVSMGFLFDSCGNFMVFLLGSYGITTRFLWEFHGGSVEFPKGFKRMSMRAPLDSYGFSMIICVVFLS